MKLKNKKVIILKEEGPEKNALENILREEGAIPFSSYNLDDEPNEVFKMADAIIFWREWKPDEFAKEKATQAWDDIFEKFIKPEVVMMEACSTYMKPAGRIIIVYSSEAFVWMDNNHPVSALAQGVKHSMVNVYAQNLGKKGILVNGISYAPNKEEAKLHYPLGSAKVDTIAASIVYLCSEDASYVNGNTIQLDAGNLLAYRRYQFGK